jgi:hypothetical protein
MFQNIFATKDSHGSYLTCEVNSVETSDEICLIEDILICDYLCK